MTYRPYPNTDRALRHLQRTRAAYQYGRVPQRYAMGFDLSQFEGMTAELLRPGQEWLATQTVEAEARWRPAWEGAFQFARQATDADFA